jgi:hypothetical protein
MDMRALQFRQVSRPLWPRVADPARGLLLREPEPAAQR